MYYENDIINANKKKKGELFMAREVKVYMRSLEKKNLKFFEK